ncbi:Potassium channel subfamily T member 2 [Toxocara canis]|uniref:Potassium channel subfamily T member 2 n=2 Tax=Toxocara canis TaxID=6265 RepID=A0A0B2VGC6_TOXCA|nr:Potassium channel subfamily T member 2 [Toxocara canis]
MRLRQTYVFSRQRRIRDGQNQYLRRFSTKRRCVEVGKDLRKQHARRFAACNRRRRLRYMETNGGTFGSDVVPPISMRLDDFVQKRQGELVIARMQYGNEQSLKSRLQQFYMENLTTSFRIRLFNLFIKVLSCVLYCVRVVNDNGDLPPHVFKLHYLPGQIKYEYLIWVDRAKYLWMTQVIVAVISIAQTIVIFYLSYKNDLNRVSSRMQSALFRQMIILLSTLVCLIFTGMCGMQHLQRGGERQFDLFTSFYFVIVTFSTVGYGDCYPDTWMSRLFVVILICAAIGILPSQIEALGQTWLARQKAGGEYTEGWAKNEKHVVVTITHLEAEFIQDFLTEFFAHPEHQNHLIILLSPCEMDDRMRMLLKIPLWTSRVLYIRGSALKDEDLERARMSTAKACFILSARHINQKNRTDEHTILRSWAVKDFAPHVPQYVQIFRPETKMHIEHAEVVVCEDEFKYSILANNCICPGISTYLTLLIHTSRGEEGQKSTEPWHKVYGFHSGNEIYDIKVGDSKFFGEFIGKSFTYASFHAHRAYGVGLLGVKSEGVDERIRLNPGNGYYLRSNDTAYYIALTNEESLFNFKKGMNAQRRKANVASSIANIGSVAVDVHKVAGDRSKRKRKRFLKSIKDRDLAETNLIQTDEADGMHRPSIGPVTNEGGESDEDSEEDNTCTICKNGKCIEDGIVKTYPPVTTYIGTSFTECEHCHYRTASEYNWTTPAIIVAADRTCSGLYNTIIPLRAYYRPVHQLQPIILLLELEENSVPNPAFLDVIAWFPLVYWMQGKISSLDNLLKAGVCLADNVIVVKEGATALEEHLADCTTIVTVQKIHRMFPQLRLITELTHSSNMRFMQFDADDQYAMQQSKFEKRERKRGSNMPFMFRLPFAQGGVFSANMLDRLLYQAVVKKYVVDFVRLLIGIDQSVGSGYLTSFKITEEDLWIRTYGRLYQKLCSSVADIPIGIYRTKPMDSHTVGREHEKTTNTHKVQHQVVPRYNSPARWVTTSVSINMDSGEQNTIEARKKSEKRRREISELVQSRMQRLGMANSHYVYDERRATISFVIINPSFDIDLEAGDIIYVLRAPVSEDASRKRVNPRRGLRRKQQEHNLSPQTHLLHTGLEDLESVE